MSETQRPPDIKNVIEVFELEGGDFIALHSAWPGLAGAGPSLEDSIVELFEMIEGTVKTSGREH